MEETENFRRFKELSNKYIHICEQKADQGTEKKTSEAQEERLSEIVRFTSLAEKTYLRTGVVDMEALEQVMRVTVLEDSTRWIWNLVDFYFLEACHIVDLYHAREHLHALIKILSTPGEPAAE